METKERIGEKKETNKERKDCEERNKEKKKGN